MDILKPISMTFEAAHGGYLYRITEDTTDKSAQGSVLVRRTKADNPLWSHGVMTQVIDVFDKAFKPACTVLTIKRFKTIPEASAFIRTQTD